MSLWLKLPHGLLGLDLYLGPCQYKPDWKFVSAELTVYANERSVDFLQTCRMRQLSGDLQLYVAVHLLGSIGASQRCRAPC